jgi:hypothetical protein
MCSYLPAFCFSFIASSEDILPGTRATSRGFAFLSSCKQKVENICESDTVNLKEYSWIRDVGMIYTTVILYVIYTVHRQGYDFCCSCDACACAEFRDARRVAAIHPESIPTVHSLTHSTLLEMSDVFRPCVVAGLCCSRHWQSSTRLYSQHLPHRARHAHYPANLISWSPIHMCLLDSCLTFRNRASYI